MAFRWRADDGLPLAIFGSSLSSSDKKTWAEIDSGSAYAFDLAAH